MPRLNSRPRSETGKQKLSTWPRKFLCQHLSFVAGTSLYCKCIIITIMEEIFTLIIVSSGTMHMKIGWSWDYESLPSAHPLLWGDYPHIIIYMFVGTLDMTLYLMITHLLLDIHDCILVSVIRSFGEPWEIWMLLILGPTDIAHRSFLMVQYHWIILLVRLIILSLPS